MSDLDDEELEATRRLNGTKRLTADEMFEELGYKKMAEHNVQRLDIEFWNDKSISKMCNYDVSYITMQELKAINKKVKELGWLDERN